VWENEGFKRLGFNIIMGTSNSFNAAATLQVGGREYEIFRLDALEKAGVGNISKLPYSIKILLENLLRNEDGRTVTASDIEFVASGKPGSHEISFMPARVLLQDFTGVPAVVDLASMRDALVSMNADAKKANPLLPVDLVIDHSVQVDKFGSVDAADLNAQIEFQRNRERYSFLRWGQSAFENFRVVPPDTGIVHQVNLEYLASVVFPKNGGGKLQAYPDTLVGTDSHTTMINGLGVLGWGVGGIEAEACMLGQPVTMLLPPVVGFKLVGKLPEGATATDLVLTVVEMLRKKGVVGKFVEFYGPGLSALTLADRATIANMGPEYGATAGFFPVDDLTLDYLRLTGRSADQIALVEAYSRAQGLFRTAESPEPEFSDGLELDVSTVVPSLAGPKRPQDRIALPDMQKAFLGLLDGEPNSTEINIDGKSETLRDGSVVIAAITSCTNTSNPSVMVAAGLLAKKAVERGLTVKPWVKTSLAPGSKVVTEYLQDAGLLAPLEALKFHLVGYGCTTCIGNSGPLPEPVANAITGAGLVVASVLSGNRNFEGRVSPLTRGNYLASPPLVVAYAIAGSVDFDLQNDSLGKDVSGHDVFLKDIWPTPEEVRTVLKQSVRKEMFEESYGKVFEGDAQWRGIQIPAGDAYAWDDASTYVKHPPFFEDMSAPGETIEDLANLRALAVLGDSVTTDHISPAGVIPPEGPAGKYLISKGVEPKDFNSFGSRRGNHEVMMRGTFANIRIRNEMAPGTEGGWTLHQPSGDQMFIYDAAMRYKEEGVGLVVIAGKEYGTGSSRDWAAKGTNLLGAKAVITESYERIHRSNLVGMGVLPLEFLPGETRKSHGLTGSEEFTITGIAAGMAGDKTAAVTAKSADGTEKIFRVKIRLDTPKEVDYYLHGGILKFVLRQLAS
jgi:aconitate hydratase A / 2-methylisocitrate dehydratase